MLLQKYVNTLMGSAKDIKIKLISSTSANLIVRRLHYSGKVAPNSKLHFGVFYNDRLEGALQFGSPIDKRKVLPIVKETKWNHMLELNRVALSDRLPKNSESRALSIVLKIIKKEYPFIEWILTFADCTQCGDGTIYRASGFKLIEVLKNKTIVQLKTGEIVAKHGTANYDFTGSKPLAGYQIKYIYFLNKDAVKRLTKPILDFSTLDKLGIGMYKGVLRG